MSLNKVYLKTKSQAHSVRKLLNTYTGQRSNSLFFFLEQKHNAQQATEFLTYTYVSACRVSLFLGINSTYKIRFNFGDFHSSKMGTNKSIQTGILHTPMSLPALATALSNLEVTIKSLCQILVEFWPMNHIVTSK